MVQPRQGFFVPQSVHRGRRIDQVFVGTTIELALFPCCVVGIMVVVGGNLLSIAQIQGPDFMEIPSRLAESSVSLALAEHCCVAAKSASSLRKGYTVMQFSFPTSFSWTRMKERDGVMEMLHHDEIELNRIDSVRVSHKIDFQPDVHKMTQARVTAPATAHVTRRVRP